MTRAAARLLLCLAFANLTQGAAAAPSELFVVTARGSPTASQLYRVASEGSGAELLDERSDLSFADVSTDPFGRAVVIANPPIPRFNPPHRGQILRWDGAGLKTLVAGLGDRPRAGAFTLDGRLIVGDATGRLWEVSDAGSIRGVGRVTVSAFGGITDLDVVPAGPFQGDLLAGTTTSNPPAVLREQADGTWRVVKLLHGATGFRARKCAMAFQDATAAVCGGEYGVHLYDTLLQHSGAVDIIPTGSPPQRHPEEVTRDRDGVRYVLFDGGGAPNDIFRYDPNWRSLPSIPGQWPSDFAPNELTPAVNPNFQDVFECREQNRTHGAYVSCVARVTQGWVKEGRITRERRQEFLVEAAHAATGMPPTARRPVSLPDPMQPPPIRLRRR